VTCRCEVLNVMTGEAAEDYADEHLEETRSDGQGRVYYRCSTTGIGWVRETPHGPVTGDSTQLRRTDRA
jgi:hypothetical protein